MAPVLACPDPEQQFFLEVDASSFTLGAVLYQKEDSGRRRDVAYFSKALTATERNYDIWDHEFLAIVSAFRTWRHLLAGTQEPVCHRHPEQEGLDPCLCTGVSWGTGPLVIFLVFHVILSFLHALHVFLLTHTLLLATHS